jgi:hypothetical protein
MMKLMLLSFLPGLREARVPLAIGYTWILTVWIISEQSLPKPNPKDPGTLGQLHELYEFLGKGVSLTAFGFALYVFGCCHLASLPSAQPCAAPWRAI